MVALEVGRVCMKIAGREAGKYCVVLKKINDAFVMITGPKLLTGVKRRRCNIQHLEPLPYTLEIKEDATEEEVISAFEKAGLVTKFNLKRPSAAELKAEKAKPEKVEEKPKKEEEVKEEKPKRKIKLKIGSSKEKEEKEEKK
jgi:large subunit ribosomal protein L14e